MLYDDSYLPEPRSGIRFDGRHYTIDQFGYAFGALIRPHESTIQAAHRIAAERGVECETTVNNAVVRIVPWVGPDYNFS